MDATGLPATNVDCVETPVWAGMARRTPWVISLLFHVGVFLAIPESPGFSTVNNHALGTVTHAVSPGS
jgi:hypothetical protein